MQLIGFWVIAAAVTFATVSVLLIAVLRRRRASTEQPNLRALHETRLVELERDLEDQAIDKNELSDAQTEIARALLEESNAASTKATQPSGVRPWLSALVIACAVPAIALLTYLELGQPKIATGEISTEQPKPETVDPAQVDELIANLEQRLVEDPTSVEGWLLLGRSYMALSRYDAAVPALKRAVELSDEMPQVLLQYADALAMADNGRIGQQARALVARVLALEPENVTALWFAGLGAVQAGETVQALEHLRLARSIGAQTGAQTAELDAVIKELEGSSASPATAASIHAKIVVQVELAAGLREKTEPQDTVFIFARGAAAGGPPLAVARTTVAALPTEMVLDDTMAMAPMFKLTDGQTVTVTARVSKSGAALAQAGDYQAASAPFVVGGRETVTLVIEDIVE